MCGRCGQVWHVVMAKMGDRIAKVVCKRCGGHHRYRDESASSDADAGGGGGARQSRRPTFGSASRRPRNARTQDATPAVPPFDPAKPPRAYAARDSYVAGERVSHPTFGVGVVSGSPGAGKVDVIFGGGDARVLACAKVTSTLARPVATQGLPIPDRPPK
jgi:hypothetical protein